jgi:hypothetical protein
MPPFKRLLRLPQSRRVRNMLRKQAEGGSNEELEPGFNVPPGETIGERVKRPAAELAAG